jgi:hypothetical protein
MNYLRGQEVMVVSKAQEASIINDLKIYIFLLGGFVGIVVLMCLAWVVLRTLNNEIKDKIANKLAEFKNGILFNGTIRSIDITYIQSVMTCGTQLSIYLQKSDYGIVENQKIALYIGSFLVILPLVYIVVLTIYGDKLLNKSVRNRCQNMYLDIHTFKSSSAKYYLPISMIRRILFVAIPALLYMYPFMQLQAFLLMNTMYLMWYAYVQPHIERRRVQTECFNEFMILLFVYHLMIFTDFVEDNKAQFKMGYSQIGFYIVIIIVNIILMILRQIENVKKTRRMEALKKSKIATMEAAFAAMEEDRKYRVKNKDRRDLVRAKLNLRAMWNESKINPITQKFKDKVELEEALRKQAFIINSLKQKTELEKKLAEIHESDKEKQQVLKEKLAVINENTNEESLHDIEIKLQGIQMRTQ